MNIRKWLRPGTNETRYYFDARFGGGFPFMDFAGNRLLNGRWIGEHNGMAHILTKTERGTGYCRTEDGDWLDKHFGIAEMTFAQWEEIFQACLTKGGNFSVAKYMKLPITCFC